MPPAIYPTDAPIRERLEAHSMPEPSSGCILWMGPYNGNSCYGRMTCDGVRVLAHRVAWAEERGPIPDGLGVLHRCDVPACINVDHMFLGTQADNDADMWAKGRGETPGTFRGSANKCAKLSESDIPKIRQDKRIMRIIAEEYGVHLSLIWLVKNRKIWMHVP